VYLYFYEEHSEYCFKRVVEEGVIKTIVIDDSRKKGGQLTKFPAASYTRRVVVKWDFHSAQSHDIFLEES